MSPDHCAQAAATLADQERSQRAEAVGLSEQLKAEAERRARVFNNAVRAAVAKVQRDLEAERDAIQARRALGRSQGIRISLYED